MKGFPVTRMRRLRGSEIIRSMVRETEINVHDLIAPLFVCEGKGAREEIAAMPDVFRYSVGNLVKKTRELKNLGIPAVILFGIPSRKDSRGSEACNPKGVIPQAIREIKEKLPEIVVIADVCLCEYMDHGHCGIVEGNKILNDPTLELLSKAAVAYAKAGADIVAPSDMMDGRVATIRRALDDSGFQDVLILSYAAKYASGFYGPFREAARSAPVFGDRRSYQMDSANAREAMREIALDIEEGADIVMIKPALPYLDVIRAARERFDVPLAAYQVSGEYAMLVAAEKNGWLDGERCIMETLLSIKRAGTDLILTYFAERAAKILGK